jgi:hypothetical protein
MRRTLLILATLLCSGSVFAAKPKPSLQPVQMPFVFRDDRGSNWDIQPDGQVGDGGNDLFDGGGRLSLNEQIFPPAAPQMDPAVNELVFPAVQLQGLNISRRIGCNAKLAYLRYTEILENPGTTPIKTTLRVYFNMGGSVQFAQPVVDEKRSKAPIGEVIGDNNNCMVHIGAGRGSKLLPRYVPQQGSDNVNVYWDVDVPARQTIAITHLVCRRANASDGARILDELSEKNVIKELPPEIARKVANFPHGERFLDDAELLRGDLFDVIELRGGDQYKGTIKQEKFKLKTSYGQIELPAERVISMFSSGQFKPRQLIVTGDGQIFGGRLDIDAIRLELSNGQSTSVPLTQITRLGYRRRGEEPDEWKFDKPMILLRGGDRMFVTPPAAPLMIATRYGVLPIKPECLASIAFVSEDRGVHDIRLTDGSKFAGLLSGDVNLKVLAGSPDPVPFPAIDLRRLQFAATADDVDADAPTLLMTNGDRLVGSFSGSFKLQTAFDAIPVAGAEVRALKRGRRAGEVQLTMWDGATLSGQLDGDTLPLTLKSGVSLAAPVGLIDTYTNPQPRPPAPIVDRIKAIVVDLNADDFRARDHAEAQLVQIGPAVVGVLKDLRATQPPEAQQRIDLVITTVTSGKPAKNE